MAPYLKHILIGIDQFFTTVVGGWPDETLSSYAYRLDRQGKLGGIIFRPVIDFLFSWQRLPYGHCQASWLSERMRYQFPPDMR